MTRPRRSEHTREALISAGIDQISMHGYHGTGIKQILDLVNVPKGSFYNFFSSKEAFVAELIHEYSQNSIAKLNDFLQARGADLNPVQQLREIYRFGLSEFAKSGFQKSCLVGALAADVGAESELCQQALQAAMDDWLQVFTHIFDRARNSGELRNDVSAEQLASTYWSAWEGSLLKLKVNGNAQAAADTMELMLGTFFKA